MYLTVVTCSGWSHPHSVVSDWVSQLKCVSELSLGLFTLPGVSRTSLGVSRTSLGLHGLQNGAGLTLVNQITGTATCSQQLLKTVTMQHLVTLLSSILSIADGVRSVYAVLCLYFIRVVLLFS